jgi:hypothetical protein
MSSRLALGPTQPPIHWVLGALSTGVMRPGCEADHSPPTSAEVKENVYIHSPLNLHGVVINLLNTGEFLPFTILLKLCI